MAIKVGDGVLSLSSDNTYFRYGIVLRESPEHHEWILAFCDGWIGGYNRTIVNHYRNNFKKMILNERTTEKSNQAG